MNILVVAHYQYDTFPTTIFIHKQLIELKNQGHHILVLTGVSKFKEDYYGDKFYPIIRKEKIDGISHLFFKYLSFSRLGMWGLNAKSAVKVIKKSLINEINNFYPEIIHAHTIGFDSEIGAWLKERYNKPLVVTIHGSDAEVPIEKNKENLLRKWCGKADEIVTVSSKLKKKLKAYGVIGRISVILNGYDSRITDVYSPKEHSVIQVGSLIPSKHYVTTIYAFWKFQKIYPDAELSIIGQGPQENPLKKLCQKLGLEDKVSFFGQISNEMVLKKMAESVFFVMPSFPEGFGIVYLEAMASGCITIGTKGEGIEDLITNGENGFLVSANGIDEIVKCLCWCEKNREKAGKIREKALESVKYLSWANNAAKYSQLYERMLK